MHEHKMEHLDAVSALEKIAKMLLSVGCKIDPETHAEQSAKTNTGKYSISGEINIRSCIGVSYVTLVLTSLRRTILDRLRRILTVIFQAALLALKR
jgi:hypothetical protein